MLITGRFISGAGAGGFLVLGTLIISKIAPLEQRGKYFGVFNSVFCISGAIGPAIGGVFADGGSWRWAMYKPDVGFGASSFI
ncbi:Tetracycline resistance protein [Smittium culicis]|uniref:Tetracycline resistance protein n=1 Tax=Smittium culicis TaxID=133412 RepID=A0A1R1YMH5_9FUNG|nr:Tetracycline resistance protein [Smittium culicis]